MSRRRRALPCTVALRRSGHARRLLDDSRARGAGGAALAGESARLGTVLAGEPLEHGLAIEALVEALALDRRAPGASEALARLKATPRTRREEARSPAEGAGRSRERPEAARLWLRAGALHAAHDPAAAAPGARQGGRAWRSRPSIGRCPSAAC